jgi:uncharacterized protein (TIGR02246 family)
MTADERAIRDVVALWHRATAAGDVDSVLGLMAEDGVFLVAGHPPIQGRDAFSAGLRKLLAGHRVESTAKVNEVEISGTLAYCWADLTVRVIPSGGGSPTVRAGSTLSIFRKPADDKWVLARDANLLAETS